MQSMDELKSLLRTTMRLQFRWKCNRQCKVCSKSVFLILTWNFIVSTAVALFTNPDLYSLITSYSSGANLIKATTFGLSGFLLLFFPLATYLADQKWGRYKTIVYSLYCLTCTATVMCALGGALIVMLVKNVGSKTLYIGLGVPILIAFLLTLFSLVVFTANVFHFGADQLIDSPSDYSSIYVYWYIWTFYAGTFLQKIMLSLASNISATTASELTTLFILIPIFVIIILGATLVFKQHCFVYDAINSNPWKLIYKVSHFAKKHKYPLRRSAFTYCDDALPTRFDFGKGRYGGPFTTEQVEDVKTFLRILQVLLVLGPIFAVEIAAGNQLPTMAYHLAGDFSVALLQPTTEACSIPYPTMLALNGSITPLIITFIIPLHIYLLRPFIRNHTETMFKRIGLGIVALILSLISTLLLNTVGHIHSSSTTCFLNSGLHFNSTCDLVESPFISPLYIIIPYTLNAFAYTLLYIGAYEFMLSQSPHEMKGLIIGLFFAIRGAFQLLAVLTVYLPFISWSSDSSFPSCGFVYYLTNLAIALIGVMAYTCISRRYQYRERDEPCYEHRYAEQYYERSIEPHENLVYKVEDDDNYQWVAEEDKKENPSSTSQATDPHTKENTTGSKRQKKLELPDHISSRDKSEK